MKDAYAALPPKKRRYASDALRPNVELRTILKRTGFIASPGIALGIGHLFTDTPKLAVLALMVLVALPSYLIANALLLGFTETLQSGVHLKRKEKMRYWTDVGLFCFLYLFVCAAFFGFRK